MNRREFLKALIVGTAGICAGAAAWTGKKLQEILSLEVHDEWTDNNAWYLPEQPHSNLVTTPLSVEEMNKALRLMERASQGNSFVWEVLLR